MAALPLLLSQSEGLHLPIRPQPQRPPPPRQPKPAVAGPAKLVTCDQTIEHTVRFAKQTLGWTTPRPCHPEQADRWTWLGLTCYAQLRLAREVAGDQRLPWERPRPRHGCHQCGSGVGFRSFWSGSARRPLRRNPPGAPQSTQRPRLWASPALSSDQEADQEPPQEADHNRRGRLTRPPQHHMDAEQVSGLSNMPTGLNHKLRHGRGPWRLVGG
jgi:hypothetical protein